MDPAAGVIGVVLGTLITGFFTWLVQRDKGARTSWKDISDSERQFRQDLLSRVAGVSHELEKTQNRLIVCERKLALCEKDHTKAQIDIIELRRALGHIKRKEDK